MLKGNTKEKLISLKIDERIKFLESEDINDVLEVLLESEDWKMDDFGIVYDTEGYQHGSVKDLTNDSKDEIIYTVANFYYKEYIDLFSEDDNE